jgi:hypothetical protein
MTKIEKTNYSSSQAVHLATPVYLSYQRNLMKHWQTLAILWLLATLCGVARAQPFKCYVATNGNDASSGLSPAHAFATLQKARDVVRAHRMQHPSDTAFVYLLQGEHKIKQPLLLTAEDGGTQLAPVIYSAFNKDRVVLNGGEKITGWRRYEHNIWVAELPQVKAGKWSFIQLFVDGKERKRARLPKTGFYRVKGFPDGDLKAGYQTKSKRFEFAQGDIKSSWKNIQDIDVVAYHFWTDTHLAIESVNDSTHTVNFKYPSGKVFTDDFNNDGARYVVENVWEGLQDPGDWYLDKKEGKLYYIPLPGEDMSKVAVYAPATNGFLTFAGNALEKLVTDIHFRNIIFEYANVQLPAGNTNDAQGSSDIPAIINLKGAQRCVFDHCTITNTGGFVFNLDEGCTYNKFTCNTITNIAAGAFKMNGAKAGENPLNQTHHNIISDNEIGNYGTIFPSAVAVLLMHSRNNEVVHNHIHHGYYTGVSVGWEWGYQRSISRDNIIAYNYIHHIGQGLLSDMGAVYTLGVSPGTVIRNNLIHDVDSHNYGGWGIYNDEGSTHILVENNIVYNTKFAGYNIHYAKELTVRNNIFALGRLQQINRTRVEPHQSVYFENNIIYWKEGKLFDGNWEDKPYDFYFNPNEKTGVKKVQSTFEADYNIYYNPAALPDSIVFNKWKWKEWQQKGKDIHSSFVNPLFIDADHFNFELQKNSPAFKMGFQPIDMQTVGPRKEGYHSGY